jgi:hypothetical protein
MWVHLKPINKFTVSETNTFSDFIENGASCLDLLEIQRERKNKDLGKNRHGALLLDFCKGNNMFILNGRLNGDKDGNCTCKGILTFSWACPDVFWQESSSKTLPCKVIDSGQCTSDNKLENSKTFKRWNCLKNVHY